MGNIGQRDVDRPIRHTCAGGFGRLPREARVQLFYCLRAYSLVGFDVGRMPSPSKNPGSILINRGHGPDGVWPSGTKRRLAICYLRVAFVLETYAHGIFEKLMPIVTFTYARAMGFF